MMLAPSCLLGLSRIALQGTGQDHEIGQIWLWGQRPDKYQLIDVMIVHLSTLKNVMNTWEEEKLHKTRARNVVSPPLKTAGPMLAMASIAFSCLVPENTN